MADSVNFTVKHMLKNKCLIGKDSQVVWERLSSSKHLLSKKDVILIKFSLFVLQPSFVTVVLKTKFK